MRVPLNNFVVALALILLVIAIPYALAQLDLIAAERLSVVPAVVAVIIAGAFLSVAISKLRSGKKE